MVKFEKLQDFDLKTDRSTMSSETGSSPSIYLEQLNMSHTTEATSTPIVKSEKLQDFDLKTDISTVSSETESSPSIYLELLNKSHQIRVDQILRDSIHIIHSRNFIKPANESCIRRLPSCIVIGEGKCGTRELLDFMHLHPHIQIYTRPKSYDMPYFKYESNDPKALKEEMPYSYSNQITAMKHQGYFHMEDVAERIQQFNKSIKLILLVREPISRMKSGLTFNKFNQDARLSKLTYNSTYRPYRNQLIWSEYDTNMERWLKYFNLSQFLIIDNSELRYDPALVLNKVEKFLGLGHVITPGMFVFNKDKGFFCINSNLTSTGMACYTGNRGRIHPSLSEELILKLTEYFKPKNERFFDLIGRSFNW